MSTNHEYLTSIQKAVKNGLMYDYLVKEQKIKKLDARTFEHLQKAFDIKAFDLLKDYQNSVFSNEIQAFVKNNLMKSIFKTSWWTKLLQALIFLASLALAVLYSAETISTETRVMLQIIHWVQVIAIFLYLIKPA